MSAAAPQIGLFTVSPALTVTSWNDWMVSATGRSPASVEGQSLLTLYPDLEERGLASRLRDTLAHGTVHMLAPAFHKHFIPCPSRGEAGSPAS
jgi:hypothetical protein